MRWGLCLSVALCLRITIKSYYESEFKFDILRAMNNYTFRPCSSHTVKVAVIPECIIHTQRILIFRNRVFIGWDMIREGLLEVEGLLVSSHCLVYLKRSSRMMILIRLKISLRFHNAILELLILIHQQRFLVIS